MLEANLRLRRIVDFADNFTGLNERMIPEYDPTFQKARSSGAVTIPLHALGAHGISAPYQRLEFGW
jgi:hypothetical protein